MRSGGGAAKGAAYERHCCRRLSLWTTNGRSDDAYWRTAMSGGRATFQLRKDIVNRAQAGDVSAISAEGIALCERYVFEIKHRKDLNFTAFVTGSGGMLTNFWEATEKVAERIGKLPVLIAKQNRYPAVVLSPIGSKLFAHEPWLVFPWLRAELHDFEMATTVQPVAAIKRPSAAVAPAAPTVNIPVRMTKVAE